jgi:hypothetical protein
MYPSYTTIYHHIPSYDGIRRYIMMSGYQGVRIPDVPVVKSLAALGACRPGAGRRVGDHRKTLGC